MKILRVIFSLIVFLAVIAIAVPLGQYQLYIFKKAADETPQAIKELPQKCGMELVKWFPFNEATALKEWEEKIFKGKVLYAVEKGSTLSYVRAKSDASASALYYKIELDTRTKNPILAWKWRAEKFPAKTEPETISKENQDDFAGRVYVIFPALFITNFKVLEYIWAETLPVGTAGASPYSKNIKLMVLRSGPAKPGEWASEERDILADYKAAFGRPPDHAVGAIAFMTNAEHTGTSADAMYADIRLGYKEDGETKGGGRGEAMVKKKVSHK